MKWLLALALVAACKKAEPPSSGGADPARMSVPEQQRSQDACKAYVERACACAATVEAAKPVCDLAKPLQDAVRISLQVAASPDSTKSDVVSAESSVRKTAKECIEKTAQLATLGCP